MDGVCGLIPVVPQCLMSLSDVIFINIVSTADYFSKIILFSPLQNEIIFKLLTFAQLLDSIFAI